MQQYFYIARFNHRYNKVPMGYEVRFQSARRFPNIDELNKATSNKFYNEITEAAIAQGMDKQFGITRDIIKGLATEGHFAIDCPSMRAEFEKRESQKQQTYKNSQKQQQQERSVPYQPAINNQTRQQSRKPVKNTSRNKNSSVSGCLAIVFTLFGTLFTKSWKFPENAGTIGKSWHVIKVIMRIAAILLTIVIILVVCFVISSIIKESR